MALDRERRIKYVRPPPPTVYHRPAPQTEPISVSLLSRFRGDYYRCPHCKKVVSKARVKISGYDSQHSMRSIRCPYCGRTITKAPGGGGLKDVATGAGYIAAGGVLSYLLYPFISLYALQLGGFLSLYGTVKMLIRPGR